MVGDCRQDDRFRDHPAVVSLGVAAYAGIPLITREDHAVGTLSVVDVAPRAWADEELMQLTFLADLAVDQFELQFHERDATLRQAWKGVPELSRW